MYFFFAINELKAMKMRSMSSLFCLFTLTVGSATLLPAQTPDPLPNVIVVMADDLGYGDVQPTSDVCKIKTPNLMTMASQGLTFTDAHTPSSVCTPTRYGLMTGRYCLLYTSPSPRDGLLSRMPSSA